jgi:peptide/nickel transport system substrate-binding protein
VSVRPVAPGVLIPAVLGALALPALASAAGSIVSAEDQAPPILNNLLANGSTAVGQRVVGGPILENLLTVDSKGRYVPLLATEVPEGGDVRATGKGLSVTFTIKRNARWSDGRPVTADDVAFTVQTIKNPKNSVASRTGMEDIGSVRKLSPKRFTVLFTTPYAGWRDTFSMSGGYYILPRHILQGKDFNTVWNLGNNEDAPLIGSGPYVLRSFTPNKEAVLERNPRWRGRAGLDRITYRFLGTTETPVVQVRSGEATLTSPPPDFGLIQSLGGARGVDVQAPASATFEHLAINTEADPFKDVAVRRAFAHALDRKGLTEAVLRGQVNPLQSSLVPFQLGYRAVFERYGYNTGQARKLLEQAGWRPGGGGIFEKDGKRLSIEVQTTEGNDQRRKNIEYLASRAKAAGIELVYKGTPADRLFGGVLTRGEYQAAVFGLAGGLDPTQTQIYESRSVPTKANGFAGQNYYRLRDKALDDLLVKSDRTIATDARAELIGRWQARVADLVPLVPLYQRPQTVAYREQLKGVLQNPTQAEVFWNSGSWSVGRS